MTFLSRHSHGTVIHFVSLFCFTLLPVGLSLHHVSLFFVFLRGNREGQYTHCTHRHTHIHRSHFANDSQHRRRETMVQTNSLETAVHYQKCKCVNWWKRGRRDSSREKVKEKTLVETFFPLFFLLSSLSPWKWQCRSRCPLFAVSG